MKLFIISLFIATVLSSTDGFVQQSAKIPLKPFNPNATEVDDSDDNNRGGRITGGKAAVDGQFPFVNEINTYRSGYAGYSLCTGAFLTPSWTITALHCTLAETPEWDPIYVIYGAASRSSPNRRTVGVDYLFWWTSGSARMDLALLRHEAPIQLSSTVGLARLPSISMENSYYNGYTVTQAGYGAGKDLQYHQLVLNSNTDVCPNINGYEYWGICAFSKTGTSLSEGGDSGSPYFIYENGMATLVGTHWGKLGPSTHAASRISSFIRDISKTVGLPLRA